MQSARGGGGDRIYLVASGGARRQPAATRAPGADNLLVRIHFIIVMIRWTGLAPWEGETPRRER